MNIKEMWRVYLGTKVLAIIICAMLLSIGNNIVLMSIGIVVALGGAFLSYRAGQSCGHEACSVLKSVEDSQKDRAITDSVVLGRTWSKENGLKTMFLSALIPYALNCLYIVLSLILKDNGIVLIISRILACGVSLPFIEIITPLHVDFVTLTWDLVLVLMVSPFVYPVAQYIGYLRGPKLWKDTEVAMAKGLRRAKARSRIGQKKQKVHVSKPEI